MGAIARIVSLAGLVAAFVGTLLIWKTGFVYESFAAWTDQAMVDDISRRNKRRQLYQRLGFGMLSAGFVLQFIGELAG